MRPGCPVSTQQPPKGGHSLRGLSQSHPGTGGLRGPGEHFLSLPGLPGQLGDGTGKNEFPVSVPGPFRDPAGGFILHPLTNVPTNAFHMAKTMLHTQNAFLDPRTERDYITVCATARSSPHRLRLETHIRTQLSHQRTLIREGDIKEASLEEVAF
jgi:hypothetical protein